MLFGIGVVVDIDYYFHVVLFCCRVTFDKDLTKKRTLDVKFVSFSLFEKKDL